MKDCLKRANAPSSKYYVAVDTGMLPVYTNSLYKNSYDCITLKKKIVNVLLFHKKTKYICNRRSLRLNLLWWLLVLDYSIIIKSTMVELLHRLEHLRAVRVSLLQVAR